MRKWLFWLLAIFTVSALLIINDQVYAQGGIAATKHNLSSSGAQAIKGGVDEICVYCHTPHGGQKTIADNTGPLWNRNYIPIPFQIYESFTLDSAPSNPPTGVSKACLSCHDGTLGINQMINRPGSGSGTNPDSATDWKIGGAGSSNNMALIGTDLRDDHPVSIVYGDAKSYGSGAAIGTDSHQAGFRGATLLGTRPVVQNGNVTLPLYGSSATTGKVECGSCHDPHEERSFVAGSSVYFLRAMNTGSQLCLTCHLK